MKCSKKNKARRVISSMLALLMIIGFAPNNRITVNAANIASEAVEDGGTIASIENVTFTARQALSVANMDPAVAVGGTEYAYALKSSGVNNGKVGSSNARVFGEIAATVETDVQLVVKMGSGKAGYVFVSDTQLVPTAEAQAAFEADDAVVTLKEGSNAYEFTAEAGKYYYLLGQGTNLEVLDFGKAPKVEPIGEAENFTFMYDDNAADGVVKTGTYKFADSELTLGGQTVDGVITQYTVKSGKTITVNGKSYEAYTSGKRHADSNNIPTLPVEGDGCLTIFKPAAEGMFTVYYNSTSFLRVHDFNNDGTKNGTVDSEVGPTEYSFKVIPGHTYVMSTTGKTNNMFYAGYSYVVDEKISVPVTVTNVDATVTDALKLELVDAQLGGDPVALKTAGDTLKLLKGHTYKVYSNDGGVKTLIGEGDTFVAAEEGVTITLNNVPDLTLSGKIVGADASCVTNLVFTNAANGTAYEATVTNDTYTVSLKPGEYNTSVETTNGAVTYDRASVQEGRENTNDVYVEVADPAAKREFSYTDIELLEKTGKVAVEAGKAHCVGNADSTVKIPVSGKAKIVVNAYYAADFTINGEQKIVDSGTTSTIDSFEQVVEGDVTIAFNATSYLTGISVVPLVEFKSELNVPGDYATLNEASDAILGMADRPEGEAGRVTINLTADVCEQVVMNAPYVTLKGNGHTISWYYGVGTLYYSVDPGTGFYNKRLAMDKYSSAEGNGNLWGGVFIVKGDNFIAEDTTFLNTYNYYLTEAEKADIAGSTINVDRLAEGADVTTHAYKERSNAFYIDADNIEVYNCKILSSQDTLGRNGSSDLGYHVYFKDCVIGGNTDYICGEFAAIFDNCELQWKTYSNDASNNAKVGYIVAPKTNPYVFRNCTITTDGNEGDAVVLGKLGRTWGANSNASFINVETNGLIDAEGWGEMNSGDKATAVFNEYNVTSNGQAYASTGATNNTLAAVENYIDTATVSATDTVLGSWTPAHYAAGSDEAVETTTDGRAVYAGESIYIVKKGDFLRRIAAQLLGSEAKHKELFNRNKTIIKNADLIFPGQELIVPKAGNVKVEDTKVEDTKVEDTKVEDTKVEDVVVDLSNGLTAGVNYGGISVLDDMAVKDGYEIDGVAYAASVQGSNNPKPNKGEIPTEGAAVKVTPKADGTFKIVFKLGTGKSYHVVDSDLNVIETASNDGGESLYLTKEYKVEAGKTYYIYGNGTKLPIYYLGLDY
ncbi:MAG: LysM peptidoglycan-binding domain-containing protein [Lachnospiraceae bacterium]|nr:LysM peptidoglycan-binding domain-containing protein [Lachnospiraceae bacterium]